MKINSFRFFIPLLIFVLIIVLLWRGLTLHPTEIASPLIDKPAPLLALPNLLHPAQLVTKQPWIGHVTLLNVWATWCVACLDEHTFLLSLNKTPHDWVLAGLDYKDDNRLAAHWLKQNGNPYAWVATDSNGTAAINWGVYGTPETFIIDKKGMIRYKQIGPITPENWTQTLLPLIQQLQRASV